MSGKHSNPTKPRTTTNRDGIITAEYWAHAPYNFVSLPNDVVQAKEPLPLNTYGSGNSGRIHCRLTTCSPTYVRGMMNQTLYKQLKGKKNLTSEEKESIAEFFQKGLTENDPCIPGSSLRGMLRSLVEIITYSRIRWVSKDFAYYFRAMAAPNDDPIRRPYQTAVNNVKGGFIRKRDDDWIIQPAPLPPRPQFHRINYFVVRDSLINRHMPRALPFSHASYNSGNQALEYFWINFDAIKYEKHTVNQANYPITIRRNLVTKITSYDSGLPYKGYVVMGGNMLENLDSQDKRISNRKYHPVILVVANPNNVDQNKNIDKQAVKDHINNLSDYQEKRLGRNGVLVEDRPVFFVQPQGRNENITLFGHSPNFRIPARNHTNRVAHLGDFTPESALGCDKPDMTDVIFGWTEEKLGDDRYLGPKGQHKGHISVSDARLVGKPDSEALWYQPEKAKPRILASPKPSTFQHYLVQDRQNQHDPDIKIQLAYYGTDPHTTELRGHKMYWTNGNNPDFTEDDENEVRDDENEVQDKENEVRDKEKQYTRITALKTDISFEFDIRFDQLRDEELGALLWALKLPGEEGKHYRHRIGMGKPYGMGAVKIDPVKLFIIEREERYKRLFKTDNPTWEEGELEKSDSEVNSYVEIFNRFILDRIHPIKANLRDLYRIREVLTMLEWHDNLSAAQQNRWKLETEYMEVENFKHRPVLPDPICVASKANRNVLTVSPATVEHGAPPHRVQVCDKFNDVNIILTDNEGNFNVAYLDVPSYRNWTDHVFLIRVPISSGWQPQENMCISVQVESIEDHKNEKQIYCKKV